MCDVSDGFKLCTCDGLTRPDWELARLRTDMNVRGKLAARLPFADRARLNKEIPPLLDRRETWDFTDYQPEEGDRLSLFCFGPEALDFRFDGKHWKPGRADFSVRYRPLRQGVLTRPADELPPEADPLLESAAAGDDEAREVAADVLESLGSPVLASWLRTEKLNRGQPPTEDFHRLSQKLSRRIRARLTPTAAISDCSRDDCPGDWGRLVRTHDDLVRRCETCTLQVPFIDATQSRVAPCVHATSAFEPNNPGAWWAFWRR